MNTFTFTLLTLATWRLASLFANEEGPFKMFDKLRNYCKQLDKRSRAFHKTYIYYGLLCEWCNSIWFGTALTVLHHLFNPLPVTTLITLPLGLSAGAVAIKYVVQTLSAIKEYYEGAGKVFESSSEMNEKYSRERGLEDALRVAANRLEALQWSKPTDETISDWVDEARAAAGYTFEDLVKEGVSE